MKDKAKQIDICRKGGRAGHAQGTAHEWTSEEARIVSRKGVLERRRRRAARATV